MELGADMKYVTIKVKGIPLIPTQLCKSKQFRSTRIKENLQRNYYKAPSIKWFNEKLTLERLQWHQLTHVAQ